LNRRVPNGTHGGVRGRELITPSYSIARIMSRAGVLALTSGEYRGNKAAEWVFDTAVNMAIGK